MARRSFRKHSLLGRLIAVIVCAVVVAVAVVAVANITVVVTTRDDVHTVEQMSEELADNPADAVVVLGASVYADGTPSDILADRLEVAVDLYKAGAAHAIICSGDNRDSHYNESDAMKAYCVSLGVPSEDVYVDHAGNTTYESIYRAHHVFGAERIIVATQAYHLYRAMFSAGCLGMQVWGVPTDKGVYQDQARYSRREVIARTKDFAMALLGVPVDTQGEAYSLDDSGDLT